VLLSETIRFLAPAVGKDNKILPVLDHLYITQGYAIAYTGTLALCCPVAIPDTIAPLAHEFAAAAKRVGDSFQCMILDNGDVTLQGNKLRVTIPCTTEHFPMPDFQGAPTLRMENGFSLVATLRKLIPFALPDSDQRPWMGTVLLRGNKAIATCGYSMSWCELPVFVPYDVTIPVEAAKAIVALDEEPVYLAGSETRFSVGYNGNRFLSSPTISTPWPSSEVIQKFLDATPAVDPIPEGFFEAARTLRPFMGKVATARVYFADGKVFLRRQAGAAEVTVDGLAIQGRSMMVGSMTLLEQFATHMAWDGKFVGWSGDGVRGCIQLGGMDG